MKMITKLISTTFKHFYMRENKNHKKGRFNGNCQIGGCYIRTSIVNSEQNAYLKMHYLHRAKSCSNL